MKLQALAALFALASATNAHSHNQRNAHIDHAKRQAPTQTARPSSSTTSSGSSGAASQTSGAPTVTGTAKPTSGPSGPSSTVPTTGIFTLTSGMPSQPTLPVTATFAAGASPPFGGAPPLPTPFVFVQGEWPEQDKIPDINSPQVQNWMKELDGYYIPDFPPTADGSCAGDPAAAAQAANRGWWTCGGHTRVTDVTSCPDKLTWGVSFDDGPSPYTPTLLKYLTEKSLLATFFVVGSRVISRPTTLVEQYMTGHEISVHTWSHKPLTSLTNEQVVAELGWTRKAIRDVLGVTPTTMRPPYGDIDDRVRAISLAMGMVPIIWTIPPNAPPFDTNDWKVAAGMVTGAQSFNTFQNILGNASTLDTGFIVLQHDLYDVTVEMATDYTLDAALSHNPPLTLMPIGKCVKIPTSDLYFESTTNTTFPYANHTFDTDGNGSAENSKVGAAVVHTPILGLLTFLGAAVLGAFLI